MLSCVVKTFTLTKRTGRITMGNELNFLSFLFIFYVNSYTINNCGSFGQPMTVTLGIALGSILEYPNESKFRYLLSHLYLNQTNNYGSSGQPMMVTLGIALGSILGHPNESKPHFILFFTHFKSQIYHKKQSA